MNIGFKNYSAMALLLCGLMSGCKSCSWCPGPEPLDPEIRRCSEAGYKALAEATAAEAVMHYRCAVRRAWAMNDSREIARNAYNLSAALLADGQCDAARGWILESRAAFHCGGLDATKTFLLESKIARRQQLFLDSEVLVDAAGCAIDSIPFCNLDGMAAQTSGFNKHLLCCAAGSQDVRCTNARLKRRLCAQTHIERAELACDLGDIVRARCALDEAEALRGHGDDIIDAGIKRVCGRILEIQGLFRLAACQYCAESGILRAHGRYREMSKSLEAAGMAFESGHAFIEAAEAYHQSARSHFGRNEILEALRVLDCARRTAHAACEPAMIRRVSLLFGEVSDEITERSGEAPHEPVVPLTDRADHSDDSLYSSGTDRFDPQDTLGSPLMPPPPDQIDNDAPQRANLLQDVDPLPGTPAVNVPLPRSAAVQHSETPLPPLFPDGPFSDFQ